MEERHRRLLEQLQEVDASRAAVSAVLADGVTGAVETVKGLGAKLGAARRAALDGRLRYLGVAVGHGRDVESALYEADAYPLRVIEGQDLFQLVEALWELEGPRAAVLASVLDATRKLVVIDRPVDLLPDDADQQVFQQIPLVLQMSSDEIQEMERRLVKAPSATELNLDPARLDRSAAEFLRKHGQNVLPLAPDLFGWDEDPVRPVDNFEPAKVLIDDLVSAKGLESRAPRAVILGAPGGGKSTLMNYLAQQFAAKKLTHGGLPLLPAVVRLAAWRPFAAKEEDHRLGSYLADGHPRTNPEWWLTRLRRGEVLLLFDGLDEVNDEDDHFVTPVLKAALNDFRQCPAVITCRVAAFSCPPYRSVLQDLPVYRLCGLSDAQVVRYAACYARVMKKGPPERLVARVRSAVTAPKLREVARNPLLLSVMCYVLSEWPEETAPFAVRAELFDDAVNRLLRRERHGREPLAGHVRKNRRRVLERASWELFEKQSGQEKALILDEALVRSAFVSAARRSRLPDPQGDGLTILEDAVERGLLQVAVRRPDDRRTAESLYSYLHLQFHEYLAGCALASRKDFVGLVFARLASPRWREVILLAVGQMALKAARESRPFLDRVRALLSYPDPFHPFLPRATLLLVTALPDLSRLPPEVIDQLATSLLAACADRDRLENFPDLARQLEQAFVRLTAEKLGERVWPLLTDRLAAVEADPAAAMAAARLIRAARLYLPETVQALLDAYPQDSPEWGHPIDAALRDVVADDIASSGSISDLLEKAIPFRRLSRDEYKEDRERFLSDPIWLWVGVVLFGGFDPRASARLAEAREIVLRAQRAERDALNRTGQAPPGPEERQRLTTAISDAQALVQNIRTQEYHLSPRFFHRPSPLAKELWELFQSRCSPADLFRSLAQKLEQSTDPALRTERLLVLAAVAPAPALLSVAPDLRRLSAALTRLEPVLAETVETAQGRVFDNLSGDSAVADFDRGRWGRLLAAVARVTGRYTAQSIFTLDFTGGDQQGTVERSSEFWQRSVLQTATSDDGIYNWCVILDTVGGHLARTPELLARSLAAAHTAGNARPGLPHGWPIDPLAPDVGGRPLPAILGSALDALAALPDGCDFVRGWALARLAPLLREAGMRAEAELLALTTLSDRFDARLDALRELAAGGEADDLESRLNAGGRLFLSIRCDAPDSYVQARFLLTMGSLFPDHAVRQEEAAAAVAGIDDPALKAWMLERLLYLASPDGRPALLAAALEAAEEIPWDDEDNRTRAVVRLAAFEPGGIDARLERHLRELNAGFAPFDATRPELRTRALATLRPYVRGTPALAAPFEAALAPLPDETLRLTARGFTAFEVVGALRVRPASMVVLGAAAVAADLRQAIALPDDPDGVWLALTTDRRDAALARLAELSRPDGLRLTRSGAVALGRLAAAGAWDVVRAVLPRVRRPDPIAGDLLARLTEHADAGISGQAVLLSAELSGLGERAVRQLVSLLQSPDYRTRSRAALTLYGDQSDRTAPLFASRLGRAPLETIMELLLQFRRSDPRVALCLTWTLERVVFDDPDLIRNWAAESAGDGARAAVARGLLSQMKFVSRAGWAEQLRVLGSAAAPARRAVLQSICVQAHLTGMLRDPRWAQLPPVLGRLGPDAVGTDYYIVDGPAAVVQAAAAAWERFGGRLPQRPRLADAAQEAFLAARQTLESALALRPESVLFKRLAEIGSIRFAGLHYDRRQAAAAARVEDRPELLRVLVPWLVEALRSPGEDHEGEGAYSLLRSSLLGVVAGAAERLPGEFQRAASEYRSRDRDVLAERLEQAARLHDTFTGRQAAFRLMAVLGRVTRSVKDAFLAVLKDTVPVQAAAVHTLGRYRDADRAFVPEALRLLAADPCPTTRYLVVRMLAAVARNIFLDPEVRNGIIDGLRQSLGAGGMREDVFLLAHGEGTGNSNVYRLEYLGRLDRLLYRELIELSGVAFDPAAPAARKEGP